MQTRDLRKFDASIARFMDRYGTVAIRFALGVVFIWFGVLKPLRMSAAESLVLATVDWMPVFDSVAWLHIIGWWEVAIGVCFLFRPLIRLAIALMLLQMVGTFMPLVLLPEVTFQEGRMPFAPTMEGQYIIKNMVLIAAAIAVGGRVRRSRRTGS